MLMQCLAFQKSQRFYNGVTQEEIESTGVLGLDGWLPQMETLLSQLTMVQLWSRMGV
jgi:hypothetical protein